VARHSAAECRMVGWQFSEFCTIQTTPIPCFRNKPLKMVIAKERVPLQLLHHHSPVHFPMQALADGPTILQQHAIAFDRSAELREQTQNVTAAADGGGGAAADGAAPPAVDGARGDAAVQG